MGKERRKRRGEDGSEESRGEEVPALSVSSNITRIRQQHF